MVKSASPVNLAHLKLFKAVADSLSLTRVSGELHVSESSISHQLRLLQKKYGVTLYKKINGGIELTEQGLLFLKSSRVILSQVESLERQLRTTAAGKPPTLLRVAASYGPSEIIVPSLLMGVKKKYPQTQVVFRTMDSWSIGRLLLRSEVEIGIVNHVLRSPNVIVEEFGEEEIVVICSRQSGIAKKSKIDLKEFALLPLIVRESRQGENETGTSLYKLRKCGIAPNVIMRCESFAAIRSAVEKGFGVGLLSRAHLGTERRQKAFKILNVPDVKLKLQRVIIYRKDKPLSPAAVEFLKRSREFAQRRMTLS
jgi:DNA-binding transcriptional LysR family regulator